MDIETKPENWILPNRIGYNKQTYKTFHPSKYHSDFEQSCDVNIKQLSLFPQQRIIRDYMQFDSPYRGILLYHELGSGKSAASIAAAEGYINRKKIVIMTPASLSQNYENELMKISSIGLNLKKSWTQLKVDKKNIEMMKILNKYAITDKFVKKDGLVWIPLYQNDIVGAEIIIENIQYSKMESKYKEDINATTVHIIRNRYKFINYNGLNKKMIDELGKSPFDDSFIIIDEIHNFISRIVNGSSLARRIYNFMLNAKNIKLVLLSGTPIINQPYEIATLINLIRGPMIVHELELLKSSEPPNKGIILSKLKENNLYKYIDEIYYDKNSIFIMLLPTDFVRIGNDDNSLVEKNKWLINESKILSEIIKVLAKIGLKISLKNKKVEQYYALPNIKEEFNKLFIDEEDPENIKVKNMDLFQRRILGTLSYYKTTGSDVFPTMLPETMRHMNMTNHQLNKYVEVRRKEMDMDDRKKRFGNKNAGDLNSVYRAFSRMICNFVFPDDIERAFPQDIRFVMKKELAKDDNKSSNEIVETDDKKDINKAVALAYDKQLSQAMDKLSKSEALDKGNLKKYYSPKFAQMLDDINTSPGSVLVYSQFRMIEGLGIFKEVLNRDGYIEINIIKNDEFGYIIENVDVFDEKYDNKRYVVFNADRTKTNILMNMFNGELSLLPDNIKSQLPDNIDQLYGKFVKTMMITQSGAEGISLKNVRRVLITEYFWNSVRIDQVIGRAVRTCSHKALPKEDQNVGVFMYIMKLTKEQLINNPTLRKKDNDLTTDEHILGIAKKKEGLINIFLDMLKSSSMDCVINSNKNKPLKNGYKCYNWAINVNDNKLSYTQNIKDDNKIQQHQKMQKIRKNKGSVVSRQGVKYINMDNKLYDYYSYINAGILQPVNI